MGAISFTHRQIVAAIVQFLRGAIAEPATIQTPGEFLDVGSVSEWLQVEISRSIRPTQRRYGEVDRRTFGIVVKCFVKESYRNPAGKPAIYRCRQLQSEIVAAIEQVTPVAILDHDSPGSPQVGTLRLFEAATWDRTRRINSPSPTGTRMAEVRINGYAQA